MVPKQLLLLVVALLFSTNVSAHDYKIKKGDTLKELSKRFDITVVELIELNGLQGGRIYIGSTIFIPDSFTESEKGSINETSSIEYAAAEGDAPSYASRYFGTTVNDTILVNNLRIAKLRIGPRLFMPLLAYLTEQAENRKNDATTSDGAQNHHPADATISEPMPPLRYSVKEGDTLSEIAGKFGVTVQDLMQKNGLSDFRLKTGLLLLIPPTGTKGIARSIPPEKRSIKYIVKDGDTIEALSKRFNIAAGSIRAANYLTDDLLTAGEILMLPDSKYEKEPLPKTVVFKGKTGSKALEVPTGLTAKSVNQKNIYEKQENDNGLDFLARRVINTALTFLGVPYKFGGNSPSTGLDCSAYVKRVFANLNIELPRTARDIYKVGSYVQKSQLAIGDLVFFRTYARYPSHVGIYLGDNKFIHASSRSKMVTIDDLDFKYYEKRYIGAKRIESIGLFYDEMSDKQAVFQ